VRGDNPSTPLSSPADQFPAPRLHRLLVRALAINVPFLTASLLANMLRSPNRTGPGDNMDHPREAR
jgi:hypothetical protein